MLKAIGGPLRKLILFLFVFVGSKISAEARHSVELAASHIHRLGEDSALQRYARILETRLRGNTINARYAYCNPEKHQYLQFTGCMGFNTGFEYFSITGARRTEGGNKITLRQNQASALAGIRPSLFLSSFILFLDASIIIPLSRRTTIEAGGKKLKLDAMNVVNSGFGLQATNVFDRIGFGLTYYTPSFSGASREEISMDVNYEI